MKIAFTICTNSFLSMARTAAASFLKHHPDYAFFIGLIDYRDEKISQWYEGYKIVPVHELGIPHLEEMAQRYNIVELSCALKSYFTEYIFRTEPAVTEIAYLDSDLYFYSPMTGLSELHQQYDIILTPHLIKPMTFDGKQPDEIAYLATGTYNGGFYSLKVTENSRRFIDWWCERMRYYCVYRLGQGLFVDQKWMNLIPVFFDKVHIIKHPGYNISYWNLHERQVSGEGGHYRVNDQWPLVFFHYSSIHLKDGILFYKQQDRFNEDSLPLVKKMFLDYRSEVYKEGYESTTRIPAHFAAIFQQHTARELKKTIKGRIKLWVKNNVSAATRNKLKSRMQRILGS